MDGAIFMDRDGVINKLPEYFPHDGLGDVRNYVTDWSQWEYTDTALEAFELLSATKWRVFVVSNQAVVGFNLARYCDVYHIFEKMVNEIHFKTDFEISGFDFCPHLMKQGCACLKPSPGMIYKLAMENDVNLSKSWMIGDSSADIECGLKAFDNKLGRLIKLPSPSEPNTYLNYARPRNNSRPNAYLGYAKLRDNLLEAVQDILEVENV